MGLTDRFQSSENQLFVAIDTSSANNPRTFIGIIPDWSRLSQGLKGIVLRDGDDNCHGWSDVDLICIHAWDSDIIQTFSNDFFLEDENDKYTIHFTRKTATAYLLTNVFLHELGHHVDQMQTSAQKYCPNGESYAQGLAEEMMDRMWPTFCRVFSL